VALEHYSRALEGLDDWRSAEQQSAFCFYTTV